jgi:uncharacterized SAM-binding protein YcdF (DUF218 family)
MGWLGRGVLACVVGVAVPVTWAVLARTLAPKANTSQRQFDTLVVLGQPTDEDGNPTPWQLASVNEAVREYERGAAPRMIFTGGAVANRFAEARVMARAAEAQGIPAAVIVEETQARNTMENACNSLRIMRDHGWGSAEVVTGSAHAPRAAMIFEQLPLKWRMDKAPPVEPESPWRASYATAKEIAKTVHYLAWSREMEKCEVSGQ